MGQQIIGQSKEPVGNRWARYRSEKFVHNCILLRQSGDDGQFCLFEHAHHGLAAHSAMFLDLIMDKAVHSGFCLLCGPTKYFFCGTGQAVAGIALPYIWRFVVHRHVARTGVVEVHWVAFRAGQPING